MEVLKNLFDTLRPILPFGATFIIVIVLILAIRMLLERHYRGQPGRHLRRQMIILLLSFAGLIIIIMALPVGDSTIGQLLSLIGILMSAAIALSAPTFVGNIMAGMMIRAVRSFRPGDFVRVGDYFGRVSEQGLFHVEIQTEDRDLTTMPNLYMITNPVKVIRSDGTIISAEISLGYDISRTVIEKLLIEAASSAHLQDPFVYIIELGDFSVTYRISGLLQEVKHVLSARSGLHEQILDTFHKNGIEIVSPTFMNTRAVQDKKKFIPVTVDEIKKDTVHPKPEELVFDKAAEAESLERLREMHKTIEDEIAAVKERMQKAAEEADKESLQNRIETLKARLERIARILTQREEENKD
jgi:small conductance mechanosensitive channel